MLYETNSSENRPSAPIDDLEQLLKSPGPSGQTWSLTHMLNSIEATRQVLDSRPALDGVPSAVDQGIQEDARLLLDRVKMSLEEISWAGLLEGLGETAQMRDAPLHRREFSFGDITYLAALSMVELGKTPSGAKPDEATRRTIYQEMLHAAPRVCEAYDAAISPPNMPLQRSAPVALGEIVLPVQHPRPGV